MSVYVYVFTQENRCRFYSRPITIDTTILFKKISAYFSYTTYYQDIAFYENIRDTIWLYLIYKNTYLQYDHSQPLLPKILVELFQLDRGPDSEIHPTLISWTDSTRNILVKK